MRKITSVLGALALACGLASAAQAQSPVLHAAAPAGIAPAQSLCFGALGGPCTIVDQTHPLPVTGGGGGGGGGGATSIADGYDATEGSKSDPIYTGTGDTTVVGVGKGIYAKLAAPVLPNGAASSSDITQLKQAIGTPLQAGSSVGLSGSLPGFATTPTFNLGSLNGAATSADITALKAALGSPMQAGASVGISGTLPGFGAPPTVNLGTLNGAATSADITALKAALGSPLQAGASVGISGSLPGFASAPTVNLGTLNGAATSADITALKAALGSPLQAGGNVGLTGNLPGFATTPTFNLGSLNGAATATTQTQQLTAEQASAAGIGAPADPAYTGSNTATLTALTKAMLTALQQQATSGGNPSVATNGGTAAGSNTQTGWVDANGTPQADGENAPHPVKDASHAQVLPFFTEGGKGAVAVGQTTTSDRYTTSAGGDFAIECFDRAPASWNGATFTLQWVAADGLTVADTAITCSANTGATPIVVNIPAKSTVLGKLTGATGSPASGINVVARYRSN